MHVKQAMLLAAGLAVVSQPAWAECLPLGEFTKQLAAKYHESPVVRAIQGGMPIVVFASTTGRTYTIVAIVQSGRTACTLAAGTDWQTVATAPPADASF